MTQCNGLPARFFKFFEDMERDNTKPFWAANRKRWEHDVRQPMQALVTELSERFDPLRIFRPHRDLRFAKAAARYLVSVPDNGDSRWSRYGLLAL